MSANFIREYVINNEVESLDPLIAKDGQTPTQFIDEFWPALRPNATEDGHVYGAPFQNSTPILYYNTDEFKDAGLDPNKPPRHLAGMGGRLRRNWQNTTVDKPRAGA